MIHFVGTPEDHDRFTRVLFKSPTDWRKIAPAVSFIRPAGFVLVAFANLGHFQEHREADAHLYYSPLAPGDLAALHHPRGNISLFTGPRAQGTTRGVRLDGAVVWDDAVVQLHSGISDTNLTPTFEAAMEQLVQWYPLADEAPAIGPYGLLG